MHASTCTWTQLQTMRRTELVSTELWYRCTDFLSWCRCCWCPISDVYVGHSLAFFAFIDLEALFVLSNKLYKLLLCNFMHLFWRLVQIKIIYCSIKHTIILQTQSFQPESPDPILRNCGKQKGTIFSHHPNVVSGVTRNTATSTTATVAQIIWNLDIKDEKKSPECSI